MRCEVSVVPRKWHIEVKRRSCIRKRSKQPNFKHHLEIQDIFRPVNSDLSPGNESSHQPMKQLLPENDCKLSRDASRKNVKHLSKKPSKLSKITFWKGTANAYSKCWPVWRWCFRDFLRLMGFFGLGQISCKIDSQYCTRVSWLSRSVNSSWPSFGTAQSKQDTIMQILKITKPTQRKLHIKKLVHKRSLSWQIKKMIENGIDGTEPEL